MTIFDLTEEVIRRIGISQSMKDLIVKPDYASLNLSNLKATVLKMLGLEPYGKSLYEMKPFKEPLENLFKHQPKKLILLLLDSLNLDLLSNLLVRLERLECGHGDILKALVTSTFPSVTPTALMTIYTGLPPLAHGVLGFEFYHKNSGQVINPFKLNSNMALLNDIFNSFDNLFEEAARSRIGVCACMPKELVSNPATQRMLNKVRIIGYRSLTDVNDLINGAKNMKLIYIYSSKLDETLHKEGSASHRIEGILHEVLALIRYSLKNGFTIILLSDHSFINVEKKVNIKVGNIKIASNGGRVVYLYSNDGNGRGLQVAIEEEENFGCFSGDQLIREGWFGEGEHSERVGEMVLIARGRNFLTYEGKESKDKATHGGFLFEEMVAPLVIFSPP